ncbi:hypothetical protein WICPIJ_009255 [Wickerhamomyces pijperi]|uniref:Uncharacterized protein n=1 Tax=Wickerhamomyces pijperi TaxID=599730 RepID=A0A9P8PPP8_WICPI|nr:hypothetical protein WICPIJ_009255 [Wickerhamomyces pijperi]
MLAANCSGVGLKAPKTPSSILEKIPVPVKFFLISVLTNPGLTPTASTSGYLSLMYLTNASLPATVFI